MKGQDKSKKIESVSTSVKPSILHDVVSNRDDHLTKLASSILEKLKGNDHFELEIGPQVDDVAMEDYKYVENISFEFLESVQSEGLITKLGNTVKTELRNSSVWNVVYVVFDVVNTQKFKNFLLEYISEKDLDKKMSFISYAGGILTIKNDKVKILSQSESNSDRLLSLIFTDKTKYWHKDEILEEWGYLAEDSVPKQLIYQAGLDVNRKVQAQTGIQYFLNVTMKKVSINRDF